MKDIAIELKAIYNTDKNTVKMFQTYKNRVLEQIPDENLSTDKSGRHLTPKNSVENDLKDYFENNIDKNKIKKRIQDKQDISDGGTYKIHVRNVSLNKNGEIDKIKIPKKLKIEKHYHKEFKL